MIRLPPKLQFFASEFCGLKSDSESVKLKVALCESGPKVANDYLKFQVNKVE
jgi:hypothetical protein